MPERVPESSEAMEMVWYKGSVSHEVKRPALLMTDSTSGSLSAFLESSTHTAAGAAAKALGKVAPMSCTELGSWEGMSCSAHIPAFQDALQFSS